MNKNIPLTRALTEHRNSVLGKSQTCLFEKCSEPAIGSHVLQAKFILDKIVDDTNHFYVMKMASLFQSSEGNTFGIQRIGINDGYKFPGFCRKHDNDVFKPIETHPIDFSIRKNLALFNYRAICSELRTRRIDYEIQSGIPRICSELGQPFFLQWLRPAELAIQDLEFYKQQAEEEIGDENIDNFDYDVIELPFNRVCLSSVVSVDGYDEEEEVDKYGFSVFKPYPKCTLNYFPYDQHSYFIIATHKQYKCEWAAELADKLRHGTELDKIVSDLLTYRVDFWAMSPEIYESLPKELIQKFIEEAHKHAFNFAHDIESNFNVFDRKDRPTPPPKPHTPAPS